jgi:eukaryotic-like serine/threonine-protein kinase
MSALTRCPTCASPLPPGDRFCGSCGHAIPSSSSVPTADINAAVDAPSAPPEARFLPGLLLAGRYRIAGLLGKGGMGEVYRADDLKLGQAVALKFLPPALNARESLDRFLQEVRTARQISHPNICRVHDAGEADGLHFLSMEYVDGEDLASLLRRIGHLPKDKALQVARQLCAGLSAAHEAGVLHRDLKPANIMIDGRGRVRITDFGLAAFAGEVGGREILAGTPAYMAPEQAAGREVSVRSDLYSLGLVLYEMFTGKRAFGASSPEELRRLQAGTRPASPSSLVEGFDPMVERVILRCLETDASRRPSSALSVAAALPGGDPLAAALAAGETPSPEMVAEAGGAGAASLAVSWGLLGVFAGTLVAFVALVPRTGLVGMVSLEKPPEVLEERAREILAEAGSDRRPADSLFTFDADRAYLEDLLQRGESGARRWDVLRSGPPSGMLFWYRQSPRPLAPFNGAAVGNLMADPPTSVPGMARVGLDPEGRLVSLLIVPGERTAPGSAPAQPDWGPLIRATGVDEKTLTSAPPEWAPPVFADRRAAWTGTWPGEPGLPLRIEAASAGGRPVALRLVEPWTRPAEEPVVQEGLGQRAARLMGAIWFIVAIAVAGIVALRNVRRGRGDGRGALRLALYLGAVRMLWFVGAHHVASAEEVNTFIDHLSFATQRVGLAYVFYLAIEPYARRLWPQMLISWVRVLEGRFRDPLVGRDLLLGSAAGALLALIARLQFWIPERLGAAPVLPVWGTWTLESLRGAVPALVAVLGIHTAELLDLIFPLTMLLVFRLLLRRTGPALVALSMLAMVLFYPDSGSLPGYIVGFSLALVLAWVVLFRVGLLAYATMRLVGSLLDQMPVTPHPAGWYLEATLFGLGACAAVALFGFWTSQAGRPLFRDEILEPAPQS